MKGWSPCKEQDSKVGWLCSNFTLQTLWQNGCCNKINLTIEELNKDSTSLILTNVKSRPCFNRVLQLSTNCLVFYFFLSLLIAAYCLLSKRNKPHMNSVKLPAFIKKKNHLYFHRTDLLSWLYECWKKRNRISRNFYLWPLCI